MGPKQAPWLSVLSLWTLWARLVLSVGFFLTVSLVLLSAPHPFRMMSWALPDVLLVTHGCYCRFSGAEIGSSYFHSKNFIPWGIPQPPTPPLEVFSIISLWEPCMSCMSAAGTKAFTPAAPAPAEWRCVHTSRTCQILITVMKGEWLCPLGAASVNHQHKFIDFLLCI